MKLLEAIKQVTVNEPDLLQSIIDLLEDRLDWMSDREPTSDGVVYDTWQEKYDYLETALDCYRDALDLIEDVNDDEEISNETKEEVMKLMNDAKDALESCNSEFGGFSRLKVY